jgi:hypothetical protein
MSGMLLCSNNYHYYDDQINIMSTYCLSDIRDFNHIISFNFHSCPMEAAFLLHLCFPYVVTEDK